MKNDGVGGYTILLDVFFLLLPFELHLLSLLGYNFFESFTFLILSILRLFHLEILLDVELGYIVDKFNQEWREAEFVPPVNLVFEIFKADLFYVRVLVDYFSDDFAPEKVIIRILVQNFFVDISWGKITSKEPIHVALEAT